MTGWSPLLMIVYQYYPIMWLICSGILCLIIGSFINVIIYRLPIMLDHRWRAEAKQILGLSSSMPEMSATSYNLIWPLSHCPNCNHPIAWFDNIPVLSWLILKGRCRHCHAAISFRYVIVEILTASLTMFMCWCFGPGSFLLGALIFTWLLIALVFIDAEYMLLPDSLTLLLLWAGLVANLLGWFTSLESAVVGAIAGYLSLWLVYWLFKLIRHQEGMGYGDFKLLAALGAWLGGQYLLSIMLLASISGILITCLLIVTRQRSSEQPIAFGIYLSLAGWVVMILAYTGLFPTGWLIMS